MKRSLRLLGSCCTALLIVALAFVLFGCNDASTVTSTKPPAPVPLSPDALLSSLTVTPGTLQPTFSSDVADYTVNVLTNVTSVTVTASPQAATASMKINGQATNSGQPRTVTLGAPGSSTPIPIVVTAQNGSQNTYIVTVNRADPASDTNLSALSVTGQTLSPTFAASTTSYAVQVGSAVTQIQVTATKSDPDAVMSGSVTAGAGQATGQATIQLNGPGQSTLITITVTAVNGNQKSYLITVNRAALGGDNNLSALSVTGQTLNPAFAAGTLNYTVNVASNVGSVTVNATKSDPNAVMSGSVTAGAGQASGQATIQLGGPGSSTPVSIIVTAPNGSQKTYTVTVNQAASASDNNLSALSVTGQTLNPAFAAGTLNYTVNVASNVANVTVSATKSDPNAVMSGALTAGAGVATGQATIPLPGGPSSTPVSIIVTAPNGSQKTYTVTVNRAAPANTNNNLSALSVSAGPLTPNFAPGTLNYNVNNVPNATTSTTVTATVADTTATLTINGAAAISGAAFGPIILSVGANPIPIVVTAQDGTPKTYTVTVNRAAPLSANNNLSALVVSAGALAPPFAQGTTSYAVINVPNATASTTVTATVADSTATLTINGVATASGVPSASIPLAVGLNTITIVVTAQNGTPKTYTVTVTRL